MQLLFKQVFNIYTNESFRSNTRHKDVGSQSNKRSFQILTFVLEILL